MVEVQRSTPTTAEGKTPLSMMKLAALFLLIISLMLAGCDRHKAPLFCDDRPGLLNSAQQERLSHFHRKLLDDIDVHLVLVVLDKRSLNLDHEAVVLFDQYRVGGETQGARGVLLVIDPDGQQVRLEIGYDLEGIFPDGFVAMIEHEQMIPFFATGRVADGIEACVELLVAKALATDQPVETPRGEKERLSGGGGARVDVAIGKSPTPPASQSSNAALFSAGRSPEDAFSSYLQVLKSRAKDPSLLLYTPETRALLRNWLVTDAQQANELKTLDAAAGLGEWFRSGELAVLRFPVNNRQLPPYFFRQAEEGWMLDLAAVNQYIGFNHLNQWRFRERGHPYMFAFQNVSFDANGFPHQSAAK